MNLLDKIESFVSQECIEMGSAMHQLIQRFVAHAQDPVETPAPAPTPDPETSLADQPIAQNIEAQ